MSDLATVTRLEAVGMITLRGDFSDAKFKKAVKVASGQAMPVSGQFLGDGQRGVAWMSPDELLIVVPYGDVEETFAAFVKALKDQHYLTADVSDARAVFRIDGADAHEVLARVCPVDLHVDSVDAGQFRRTRMAQAAAAFWKHDTGFDVVCFRSVGDYVEQLLRNAAKGAKVGALN
jgi:sarcosine oxidase subunit gamma